MEYCICSVYVFGGVNSTLFSLSTTKPEHKVKSGLLLDVVVRKCAPILKLLSSKDETLLIWWDALLVLDLSLHIFNRIGSFDLESDGLSCQGLDKDLHTTTKPEHKMEGRLLLNVVIREGAPILELLSGKDETLLIWWDALLVLDLGFHIFDCIRSFNLESDGLSS